MLLAVLRICAAASLVVNQPIATNAARLNIHKHTLKGENSLFYSRAISQGALGRMEQYPGHFERNQYYISFSETLSNSVKYPIKSVNDPFKGLLQWNIYSLNNLNSSN